VYSYAQQYPQFPHQSTGDQFFDESQFESYRALGFQSMVKTIFGKNPTQDFALIRQRTTEELFDGMRRSWPVPG
jgi:hypothetical protein